jgi:hypothetical protein
MSSTGSGLPPPAVIALAACVGSADVASARRILCRRTWTRCSQPVPSQSAGRPVAYIAEGLHPLEEEVSDYLG